MIATLFWIVGFAVEGVLVWYFWKRGKHDDTKQYPGNLPGMGSSDASGPSRLDGTNAQR